MPRKLYIKLQTPTIELSVTASDPSGATDTIIVGFKRYDLKEVETKLKDYQEVLSSSSLTDSDEYLKKEIIYIKNAYLETYEEKEGQVIIEPFPVTDTRNVIPNEFFQDSTECLAVLLDKYVSSAPWKNSLYMALQKALLNTDFSEDKAKN